MEETEKNKNLLAIVNSKGGAKAPKKPATPKVSKPKASKPAATEADDAKKAEAMQRVNDLLKGSNVSYLVEKGQENTTEQIIEEVKEERTMQWLEQQVELLSKQVQDYEGEIIYLRQQLENVPNPIDGMIGEDVMLNPAQRLSPDVVALYRHFEYLYINQVTEHVKLAYPPTRNGILDKFLEYFPQLENIRQYRYRGVIE